MINDRHEVPDEPVSPGYDNAETCEPWIDGAAEWQLRPHLELADRLDLRVNCLVKSMVGESSAPSSGLSVDLLVGLVNAAGAMRAFDSGDMTEAEECLELAVTHLRDVVDATQVPTVRKEIE